MEIKRCLSLPCAAEKVKSQGLLHVEKQDGMRILDCSDTENVVLFLQKANMQLPDVSNPSHKAGIVILTYYKTVKVGKLSGNILAHLELWLQNERKKNP